MEPGTILWINLGHSYGRWPAIVAEHQERPALSQGTNYKGLPAVTEGHSSLENRYSCLCRCFLQTFWTSLERIFMKIKKNLKQETNSLSSFLMMTTLSCYQWMRWTRLRNTLAKTRRNISGWLFVNCDILVTFSIKLIGLVSESTRRTRRDI